MKSIRAKFSILLILVMSVVLFISNCILYSEEKKMYLQRIMDEQSLIISSNQRGIEYFLRSIDQSFQYLISDKLVGNTLSRTYTDPMELLNARSDVTGQFFHCTAIQNETDGYSYRSVLFLNDNIPLTSHYKNSLLNGDEARLSAIYSNTLVKEEVWYQKAVALENQLYIFIDEEYDKLCFARKVQNLYYVGPAPKDGIGVMVPRSVCVK